MRACTLVPVARPLVLMAGVQFLIAALALMLSVLKACGACGSDSNLHIAVATAGIGGYAVLLLLGWLQRRAAFFFGVFCAVAVHAALAAWMLGTQTVCPVCVAAGLGAAVLAGLCLRFADTNRRQLAWMALPVLAGTLLITLTTLQIGVRSERQRLAALESIGQQALTDGAAGRSEVQPLSVIVFENKNCRHCVEFKEQHLPRLEQDFGSRVQVQFVPARQYEWVRATPTIVVEGGSTLEGVTKYEQLRTAVAKAVERQGSATTLAAQRHIADLLQTRRARRDVVDSNSASEVAQLVSGSPALPPWASSAPTVASRAIRDIRDFGVTCSGSDEAAKVQTALNSLQSGDTLNISCRVGIGAAGLRMSDKSNVTVRASATGAGFTALAVTGQGFTMFGPFVMVAERCTNCVIENLEFRNNDLNVGALGFSTCTQTVVQGNKIFDVGDISGGAISGSANRGNRYIGNTITNMRDNTRGMWLGNVNGTEEHYPYVTDNLVTDGDATGIATHAYFLYAARNTFRNITAGAGIKLVLEGPNIVENIRCENLLGVCVQVEGSHTVVRNCTGVDLNSGGVTLPSPKVVQDVVIRDNDFANTGLFSGVLINAGRHLLIERNKFYDTRSGTARTHNDGIRIEGSSGPASDIEIIDNYSYNAKRYALVIWNYNSSANSINDIRVINNRLETSAMGLKVDQTLAPITGVCTLNNTFAGNGTDISSDIALSTCATPTSRWTEISTLALPNATSGQPYSYTLQRKNGTGSGTVTWRIYRGALPTGLTLSTSGVIAGNTSIAGTYELFVEAVDSQNRFDLRRYTLTVAASELDRTAPSIPTGLTASAVSSSQINLSWSASTDNVGVSGYKVYRGGTQIATVSGTTYQNTGLTPSTTYSYSVAAYDAAGNNSAQSAPASATTNSTPDGQAPTVPTALSATAVTSSQINLSWSASSDNVGVTGYKLYRGGTQIATVSGTSYQNTGLSANTSYTYTVAAYDAAGNTSAQSGSASATTHNSAVTAESFITAFTPGTPRNNFTGWVGMKFTVSSQALTVSSLGRIMLSGNSGTHTLKLVNAVTGGDVSGGSLALSMTGGTVGQFKYATLPSPVTLAANATYYLVSQEGGSTDSWYDFNTVVTPTVHGAVVGAVWQSNGQSIWNPITSANHSYGPVTFQYTVSGGDTQAPAVSISAPAAGSVVSASVTISANAFDNVGVAGVQFRLDGANLGAEDTSAPYSLVWNTAGVANGSHTLSAIARDAAGNKTTSAAVTVTVNNTVAGAFLTSYIAGTVRTDGNDWVGLKLTVASQPLSVSSLGRIMIAGNSKTHTVRIVHVTTNTQVASASISMLGGTAGQFKYVALATPVTLAANSAYYLVSSENTGDAWYDFSTTVVPTVHGTVQQAVWKNGTGPWNLAGTANHSYVPANFLYTVEGPQAATALQAELLISAPSATPNPAEVNQPVQFTAVAGADATLEWDFGDGARASGASVTHTYASAGSYNVQVTISNGAGTETAQVPVTITASATKTSTDTAIELGTFQVGQKFRLKLPTPSNAPAGKLRWAVVDRQTLPKGLRVRRNQVDGKLAAGTYTFAVRLSSKSDEVLQQYRLTIE